VEKLREEGLGELAEMMSTTVQQADQVLEASSSGSADAVSILAAHSEVVKTVEKLKAEGRHQEAAKMEEVAAKLQVSLQAQCQPGPPPALPTGEKDEEGPPPLPGGGKELPP